MTTRFFRHGERAPLYYFNYPADTATEHPNFPYELGEMTNVGIQQLYTLGSMLRETYGALVNYTYVPSQLRAVAGNDNRTIVSATVVLAGLFSPNEQQIWNAAFNWQPIPVHTNAIVDEVSFTMFDNCEKLSNEIYSSEEFEDAYNANYDLIKFLENKTGLPVPHIRSIDQIVDSLKIRSGLQDIFTLPEWADDQTLLDALFEKDEEIHQIVNDLPQVKPFVQGWTINEIVANMENRVKKWTNHKLVLYSGHDDNLMILARSLNLSEIQDHLPSFAAYISIELHFKNGNHIVELYYHADENSSRVPLSMKACQRPCRFETFKTLVPRVSPDQWSTICHGQHPNFRTQPAGSGTMVASENDSYLLFIIILAVVCVVLAISLFISCCVCCRLKQKLTKLTNAETRKLLDNQQNRPLYL